MSQSQGRPLRLSHGDVVRWRAQLLVTGTCHVWMGAVGSDGIGQVLVTGTCHVWMGAVGSDRP